MSIRCAIVFGGRSQEHEISIISASHIIDGFDLQKYVPIPIYISRSGKWLSRQDSAKVLDLDAKGMLKNEPKKFQATLNNIEESGKPFHFDFSNIDVVFPVLHGSFGEDGTIQGLFEIFDIPYVGCDVASSCIIMDKVFCKHILSNSSLPVLPWVEINSWCTKKEINSIIQKGINELGYPLFVKPAKSGSSIGINKARNKKELLFSIEEALKYDSKVLIEKGINNPREIEIGIIGYGKDALKSSIGEILPDKEFYDYFSKYISNSSKLLIPAPINQTIQKKIHKMSLLAAKSLGVESLARIDFLIDKTTNNIYINELNTMPGFTHISMFPKMFSHAGVSYKEILEKLIELALKRFKSRKVRL